MIEFLQLPEERKRTFIAQAATETGMKEKAVEKDWWVTLVLRAIFTLPMAEHFVFKGGTSLSKG
jgi:predicted nucleotidyltransferase component of viral defense system